MEFLTLVWFFGYGPLAAALVIGLFWAALAHPERIRSTLKLRLSALFLGGAVVAGIVIPLILLALRIDRSDRSSFGEWIYLCAFPPVLLVVAIYLGIDAVLPARKSEPVPPREAESSR